MSAGQGPRPGFPLRALFGALPVSHCSQRLVLFFWGCVGSQLLPWDQFPTRKSTQVLCMGTVGVSATTGNPRSWFSNRSINADTFPCRVGPSSLGPGGEQGLPLPCHWVSVTPLPTAGVLRTPEACQSCKNGVEGTELACAPSHDGVS